MKGQQVSLNEGGEAQILLCPHKVTVRRILFARGFVASFSERWKSPNTFLVHFSASGAEFLVFSCVGFSKKFAF